MFEGLVLTYITLEFEGHILQTLNPNLMLSFVNDWSKALFTHVTKMILFSSM
jgi:hypothetical protein